MAIGNPFGLGGSVIGGHRFGAQPRHFRPVLWPVHPDGRGHQQGQFRRPAVQHGWRRDRHQHGDPVALGRLHRHRLRRAVVSGGARDRPAHQVRRDPPRLARRAHPERRRRHRREPRPRQGARRAGRRHRREGPGQARGHRGGRRHRQVRRHRDRRNRRTCRASSARRRSARPSTSGSCARARKSSKTVTLGRLEEGEKVAKANVPSAEAEKPAVKKALGLELTVDDGRAAQALFRSRKTCAGVLVTRVDPNSPASDKRIAPGDVIVEVQQEPVDDTGRHDQAARRAEEGGQEVRPSPRRERPG